MNKNFFLLVYVFSFLQVLNAQTNPKNFDLKSILKIDSDKNHFVGIPRVTEKERYEIKDIEIGLVVYQTDNLSGIYYYSEKGWTPLSVNNSLLKNVLVCSKVSTVETFADLSTIHQSCGMDVTTAIVLGYHEKDDGGGGIFIFDSNLVSQNDGGLIFNGWKRSIVDSYINVKNLPEGKIILKDLQGVSNQTANEFICLIEYF